MKNVRYLKLTLVLLLLSSFCLLPLFGQSSEKLKIRETIRENFGNLRSEVKTLKLNLKVASQEISSLNEIIASSEQIIRDSEKTILNSENTVKKQAGQLTKSLEVQQQLSSSLTLLNSSFINLQTWNKILIGSAAVLVITVIVESIIIATK